MYRAKTLDKIFLESFTSMLFITVVLRYRKKAIYDSFHSLYCNYSCFAMFNGETFPKRGFTWSVFVVWWARNTWLWESFTYSNKLLCGLGFSFRIRRAAPTVLWDSGPRDNKEGNASNMLDFLPVRRFLSFSFSSVECALEIEVKRGNEDAGAALFFLTFQSQRVQRGGGPRSTYATQITRNAVTVRVL